MFDRQWPLLCCVYSYDCTGTVATVLYVHRLQPAASSQRNSAWATWWGGLHEPAHEPADELSQVIVKKRVTSCARRQRGLAIFPLIVLGANEGSRRPEDGGEAGAAGRALQ
jgi:hypothetical protein